MNARPLLAAVVACAAVMLAPRPACAQEGSGGVPSFGSEACDTACDVAWVGGALGGAVLATTELILIVDGLIRFGHGHGVYEGSAIAEVVIGLAHFAPVAVASWAVAAQDDPDVGFVALGFASGALGAYFLAHGLWSLTAGRPPPSHFAIGLAPRPGGATVTVGGAL